MLGFYHDVGVRVPGPCTWLLTSLSPCLRPLSPRVV